MAYKEGMTAAKVTFTNDDSGEYLFHELKVTTTAPDIQETLEIEASVRSLARRLITVTNPLRPHEAITFPERESNVGPANGVKKDGWWQCSSPHVRLARVGEMAGNLEGVFAVDYRPLVPSGKGKPEKAELSFVIEELGTYRYALVLSAKPPASSSSLRFESALGAIQTEAFTMRVFNSSSPADFECKLAGGQDTQFRVPSRITAPPCNSWEGQDLRIEVVFEPEFTGKVEASLVASSVVYGTYECSLRGVCSPPLPQGPFTIPLGGQREIRLRNVFAAAMDFTLTCDNPTFTVVGGDRQNVPGKSSKTVTVKYAEMVNAGGSTNSGASRTATGKLIAQCVGLSDTPPWVFYLQGVPA